MTTMGGRVETSLVVNEIYGPVWQGEGPSAGRLASIVRLMGCNLTCSWTLPGGGRTPCDEAQTWDASRFDLHAMGHRMTVTDILDRVVDIGAGMVIVTGGEPMLWQDKNGWAWLLGQLDREGFRVEVETNGTIIPALTTTRHVDQFNVSPKLSSSGGQEAHRLVPAAMRAWRACERAVFKFVVTGPGDLAEAGRITDVYGIPRWRTWIMPAGDTPEVMVATAQAIAPAVAEAGYNLTLRSHLLLHPGGKEPR